MFAEDATVEINDWTCLFRDVLFEELTHGNLADEADTLGVFAVCVGEIRIERDLSDLWFRDLSEWEQRMLELIL